jgi:accessory colonization factor AcfC
MFLPT